MDAVSTSLWPEQYVKCAMLEFRNDLITDPKYRANMVKIISPVLNQLSERIWSFCKSSSNIDLI